MVRKKSEGIKALVEKHEPVPLSEMTMLDLVACFALMNISQNTKIQHVAEEAYDIAEAVMAERERRM